MMSPTHPKTRSYFQRGLFDGLTSFRELEGRISGLATKGERGDAFEVFAEAYLATVAVEKAKHVWPGGSVPQSLRKRLALTIGDKGVDGIFETQLGEYHAYQAKFRTSRLSLTWNELSTFIGLADRVEQRVLFTNCDCFADVVKQRTGFYAITGNDLDKLEPQDFAVIRAWLEGASLKRQRKNPLPHQAQAIDNLLFALRDHDRATALMACGTGKTLVALWVAERMSVQNILVLLPSLALLRQTLHEWVRETSWQSFAHLGVCSDPTVKPDSDELVVRPTDLDFPVSTDGAQVRAFLAAKFDGVKLVFSTYQSADVVAAGMKRSDAFDLAIFDEAHKTAGREDVHFGFALNDKRLPIRKRLFLTATPRHYDIRRRDKEGDARLVYSMDAPEVYGPVAHKLTFAEAARRGIICGYKVIISVVTSDMVNDHLLRHGEVIVKGDAVKARQVANQLALQAAVAQHGVSKIFTFHRSVASAAAFTRDGPEGIGNHLSGFDAFHVNGAMPTSERENIMTEFRAVSKAVISNAKCLTEGVDVPAVDMVAFLAPKRSRVDIVQATGRAMRKASSKTTGYVLVPLFVEQAKGETIEEALARTEFDEVWNVLQAMQEQDELLAEIIREMREDRGRTKGFDDTRFCERVEFLGPQISLETLRDSIITACIEMLGDNWEERYGELKAFKERFGHSNVPQGWRENPQLGRWARKQRGKNKSGELSEDRRLRLEQIGFLWDPLDSQWEEMFGLLVDYKRTHNDCRVPVRWRDNPQLGRWVDKQRQAKKDKRIGENRIGRLEELGFVWDPFDKYWEEMYSTLERYRKRHGDCNVPQGWEENPSLGSWVATQRTLKRDSKLTEERIRRLAKLKFVWEPIDSQWEEMFAALTTFKGNYGHCNVPNNWPEHPQLRIWLNVQRRSKKKGSLTEKHIERLDELGIVWDPRKSSWEDMFEALLTHRRKHGNCNVPDNCVENPPLSAWVSKQRIAKKKGTLSTELVRRLDQVGLVWEPISAFWDQMFAELAEFKHKQGHCNVPRSWQENPQLATWVGTQRQLRQAGRLSEGRIQQLENIGFSWDPRDARWKKMFTALAQYRKQNGDCRVPQGWRHNPKLGKWVDHQRHFKKSGILSEARIRRLDEIGFQWAGTMERRKGNT
jgi:superfamily II DNA or RNA helicase